MSPQHTHRRRVIVEKAQVLGRCLGVDALFGGLGRERVDRHEVLVQRLAHGTACRRRPVDGLGVARILDSVIHVGAGRGGGADSGGLGKDGKDGKEGMRCGNGGVDKNRGLAKTGASALHTYCKFSSALTPTSILVGTVMAVCRGERGVGIVGLAKIRGWQKNGRVRSPHVLQIQLSTYPNVDLGRHRDGGL